jgi:RimJ/RimL family protein N-acetyltransferase
MVEIETERLLLRGWRDEDVEPYSGMCADPEVMRLIGEGSTLTREQSEAQISRFVRHWDERGFGLWALEEKGTGTFVGFAGLAHQEDWAEGEHKTEVGWRLDRAFWGRGLATEAAKAGVAYGFETLGLERIISIIQLGNTASQRVAEKAGLSPRGETCWRGTPVVWYAIVRRDRSAKLKSKTQNLET